MIFKATLDKTRIVLRLFKNFTIFTQRKKGRTITTISIIWHIQNEVNFFWKKIYCIWIPLIRLSFVPCYQSLALIFYGPRDVFMSFLLSSIYSVQTLERHIEKRIFSTRPRSPQETWKKSADVEMRGYWKGLSREVFPDLCGNNQSRVVVTFV